jgi:hypothetical protein
MAKFKQLNLFILIAITFILSLGFVSAAPSQHLVLCSGVSDTVNIIDWNSQTQVSSFSIVGQEPTCQAVGVSDISGEDRIYVGGNTKSIYEYYLNGTPTGWVLNMTPYAGTLSIRGFYIDNLISPTDSIEISLGNNTVYYWNYSTSSPTFIGTGSFVGGGSPFPIGGTPPIYPERYTISPAVAPLDTIVQWSDNTYTTQLNTLSIGAQEGNARMVSYYNNGTSGDIYVMGSGTNRRVFIYRDNGAGFVNAYTGSSEDYFDVNTTLPGYTVGSGWVGDIDIGTETIPPTINITSPVPSFQYLNEITYQDLGVPKIYLDINVTDDSGVNETDIKAMVVNSTGDIVSSISYYSGPGYLVGSEGVNTVYINATDTLGNIAYANVTVFIDTVSPLVQIFSPQNAIYSNSTQLINISTDNTFRVTYNYNGTNVTYYEKPLDYMYIISAQTDNLYRLYTNGTYESTVSSILSWDGASQGLAYSNIFRDIFGEPRLYMTGTTTDVIKEFYVNGTQTGRSWSIASQTTNPFSLDYNENLGFLVTDTSSTNKNIYVYTRSYDGLAYLKTLTTTLTDNSIIRKATLGDDGYIYVLNSTTTGGYIKQYSFDINDSGPTVPIYFTGNETPTQGTSTNMHYYNNSLYVIVSTEILHKYDFNGTFYQYAGNISVATPATTITDFTFANIGGTGYQNEYVDFPSGNNTLNVYSQDYPGNINSTYVTFNINVTDTTPPNIDIISPTNTSYNNSLILINISSDGDNIWYNYNGTNITYGNTVIPAETYFYAVRYPPAGSLVKKLYTNFSETGFSFSTSAQGSMDGIFMSNHTGEKILYMSEWQTNMIYGYYLNGTYTGFNFSTTSQFNNPRGIAVKDGIFNIVGSSGIYRYDENGTYIDFKVLNSGGPIGSLLPLTYNPSNNRFYTVGVFTSDYTTRIIEVNGNDYSVINSVIVNEGSGWQTSIDYYNGSLWMGTDDGYIYRYDYDGVGFYNYSGYSFNMNSVIGSFIAGAFITENTEQVISPYLNLSDGSYTLHAYANDTVGNLNTTSVNFIVNTTYVPSVPTISIDSPLSIFYNFANILFQLTSNGDYKWYSINGGANNTYTTPLNITFVEGLNTIVAYANNSAGVSTTNVTFTVDTIAPNIQINHPVNGQNYTNRTQLLNITSNGDNVWYNYNGTNITYVNPTLVEFNENGNTLNAYANDTAGNFNLTSVSFKMPMQVKEFVTSEVIVNFTTPVEIFANVSEVLVTSNNFIFVNTTSNPEFNVPAQVTLLNVPTNFTYPGIFRNGQVCPPVVCVPLTDLRSGNVSFSVPGFSSYTIGELSGLNAGLLYYYGFNNNLQDVWSGNDFINGTNTYRYISGGIGGTNRMAFETTWFNSTSNNAINGSAPRTLSVWVRSPGTSIPGMYAVSMGTTGTNNYMWSLTSDWTTNKWFMQGFGGGNDWFGPTMDTNWHHHVITYNGTFSVWYVDGAVFGNFTHTYDTAVNKIFLNYDGFNTAIVQNETIDELGIWNRALNGSEVTMLYNSGYGLVNYNGTFIDATSPSTIETITPSQTAWERYRTISISNPSAISYITIPYYSGMASNFGDVRFVNSGTLTQIANRTINSTKDWGRVISWPTANLSESYYSGLILANATGAAVNYTLTYSLQNVNGSIPSVTFLTNGIAPYTYGWNITWEFTDSTSSSNQTTTYTDSTLRTLTLTNPSPNKNVTRMLMRAYGANQDVAYLYNVTFGIYNGYNSSSVPTVQLPYYLESYNSTEAKFRVLTNYDNQIRMWYDGPTNVTTSSLSSIYGNNIYSTYTLEEYNSTTSLSIGAGNNLTSLTGNFTTGKIGDAYNPNNENKALGIYGGNLTGTHSVSMWFKNQNNSNWGANYYRMFAASSAWEAGGWGITTQGDSGSTLFYTAFFGGSAPTYGNINDGRFHNVIVSVNYTSSKYQVFLDGVQVGTDLNTGSSDATKQFYLFGAGGSLNLPYNTSLIDDVMLFNSSISLAQAQVINSITTPTISIGSEVYTNASLPNYTATPIVITNVSIRNETGNYVNFSASVSNDVGLSNATLNINRLTQGACYQETANVSTACGGLNTGVYSANITTNTSNSYDGNYNTFAIFNGDTSKYYYVNYTLPVGVQNTSNILQWKTDQGIRNDTIPVACIQGKTKLQLKIASETWSAGCFPNGLVTMGDGTYKEISEIEIGDEVLSWDEETNQNVVNVVTYVEELTTNPTVSDPIFHINGNLNVTPNHWVFVDGKWIQVADLKVGDYMIDSTFNGVLVTSITYDIPTNAVPIYSFEVNNTHTYYVNGYLVHNSGGGGGDFILGTQAIGGGLLARCWDGSSFIEINRVSTSDYLYDEAIYWNLGNSTYVNVYTNTLDLNGLITTTVSVPVALVDGIYNWFWSLFGINNQQVVTPLNEFDLQATYPQISFVGGTPTNGENYSNNPIYFEIDTDQYADNLSVYVYGDVTIPVQTNLTTSIVAYWNFDNSSTGGLDVVRGVLNATLTGTGNTSDTGKIGGGWSTDGGAGNYVATTIPAGYMNLSNWDGFTLNFWLREDTNCGASCNTNHWYATGKTTVFNYLDDLGGGQRAWGWDTSANLISAGGDLPVGEWHMISATWNKTHLTAYVDGNYVGNAAASSSPDYSTLQVMLLAQLQGGTSESADEYGIWNKSLSASEISQLYNSGNGLAYSDMYDYTTVIGLINSTTITPVVGTNYINLGVPSDGSYSFNASATNGGGLTNWTETRNIVVDTQAPVINSFTPQESNYRTKYKTVSGITSTYVVLNVTYDSDMQTDFDDVLFRTTSGTNLGYARISYVSGSSAIFRVNANGQTTIRMYYGNSNATYTGNVSQVYGVPVLAFWTFDEPNGGNLTDYSGNGINFTNMGNIPYNTGRIGKAANITSNPSQYYQNNQIPQFVFGKSNWTMTGWIKTIDTNSHWITNRQDGSGSGEATLAFPIGNNNGGSPGKLGFYKTSPLADFTTISLATNNWLQLTAVKQGTNMYIYINGTLDKVTAISDNDYGSTSWDWQIAGADLGTGEYLGQLDDMMVITTALTSTQAAQMYNITDTGYAFGNETSSVGVTYIQNSTTNFTVNTTDNLGIKNATLTIIANNNQSNNFINYSNWSLSGWLYRKPVYVEGGAETLNNFTVYLNISYSSGMQADFDDLRFYNGCYAGATALSYELDNRVNSSYAGVWVKVPTLTTGTNTLCMYYGNSTATSGSDPVNAWDGNYTIVMHFNEVNVSAGNYLINSKDGTNFLQLYGTPTRVSGRLGNAINLSTSSYALGSGAGYDIPNTWTTETSIYPNGASGANRMFFSKLSGRGVSNYGFSTGQGPSANQFACFFGNSVWNSQMWMNDSTSQWNVQNCYSINGVVDSTFGFTNLIATGIRTGSGGSGGSISQSGSWALSYYDGTQYWGNAVYDEVRMSNVQRSSAWLNRSYEDLRVNNTIYSFGTEEVGNVYRNTTTYSPGVVTTIVSIPVGLLDGIYTWFWSIFDWTDNQAEFNNQTLYVDTTAPTISFVSPTTSTGYQNTTTILANVSVSDAIGPMNVTIHLDGATSSQIVSTIINATSGYYYANFSTLNPGVYSLYANVSDMYYTNSTEVRTIRIDIVSPVISSSSPSSNWFNSGWSKRKEITVTTLDTEYIVNQSIYLNVAYDSDMQSDFDDLRFTDINNNELGYWFYNNTYIANNSVNVYVKLPQGLNSTTSRTIYMYYGNSTVTTTSNINNAFIFADDFNTAINWTSKWQSTNQGLYSTAGGILTASGTSTSSQLICTNMSFSNGYVLESRDYQTFVGGGDSFYHLPATPTPTYSGPFMDINSGAYRLDFYGGGTTFGGTPLYSTYQIWNMKIPSSGIGNVNFSVWNDGKNGTRFSAVNTGTMFGYSGYVCFLSYQASQVGKMDWMFVREYSTSEPTTTFGSESIYSNNIYTNTSLTNFSINAYDNNPSLASLKTDLRYYYTFNDNLVDSVSGNNLTNFTSANNVQYISGGIGGTKRVNLTDTGLVSFSNTGISGSGERTLSFWSQVRETSVYKVMAQLGYQSGNNAFSTTVNNNQWLLQGNVGGNDYQFGTSNTNWNHHVITYNTTTALWYINGVLTGTFVHAYATTDTPISINHNYYLPSPNINNLTMDELGVWNRSLSSSEVSLLYNSGNGIYYSNDNFVDSYSSGLSNATLTISGTTTTGTAYTNTTTTSLGGVLQTVVSIPVTLADGVYNWFWRLFDLSGNQASTQNSTLVTDTVTPIVTLVSPNYQDEYINATSCTAVSLAAPGYPCYYGNDNNFSTWIQSNAESFGPTDYYNFTLTDLTSNNFTNYFFIGGGNQYVRTGCYNYTSGSYIQIAEINTVGQGSMNVTYTLPSQCRVNNQASIYVSLYGYSAHRLYEIQWSSLVPQTSGLNVSSRSINTSAIINEVNPVSITYNLYNNNYSYSNTTSISNYTGRFQTYQTLTAPTDGTYYYNATVVDAVGHIGYSDNIQVTIDTANPNITVLSPNNETVSLFSDGFIRYYTLDSYNNTESLYGVHNLYSGPGMSLVPGKFGNAYNFTLNTNSYAIDLNGQSDLPLGTSNRTISYWVYHTTSPNNYGIPLFFGDNGYGGASTWRMRYLSSPNMGFSGDSADWDNVFTVPNGQWVMITLTYDGTALRYYMNNQSYGPHTVALNTIEGDACFMLGGENSACGDGAKSAFSAFNGAIDNVAIWNRTLSLSEINTLYNNGTGLSLEPSITISNSTNYNYSNQTFIADITDNLGIQNTTLTINSSTNQSFSYTNTTTYSPGTLTSTVSIPLVLADGVYNWFWKAYDWAANLLSTQSYETLIDTTTPLISFVSPTYDSGVNISSLTFPIGLNITETNPVSLTLNIYNSTWTNSTTYNITTLNPASVWNSLSLYYNGNDSLEMVNRIYNLSTSYGSPSYTATGAKLGKSMIFTSADGLSIADGAPTIELTGSTTSVNFWFKSDLSQGNNQLLTKYDGGGNGYYIEVTNTGFLEFAYFNNGGGDCSWPAGSVTANNWTMVTLVKNGTTTNTYRNGQYMSTCTGTLASTTAALYLARNTFGSYLVGGIDELGFWNRLLTASEIQSLYNSNVGTTYSAGLALPSSMTAPASGRYYYNATTTDLVGHFNTTESRLITLDIVNPNATIIAPNNISTTSRIELWNATSTNYTGRIDNTPQYAFDGDWSTAAWTGAAHASINANFYENYTLSNYNSSTVNVTFKVAMSNFQSNQNISVYTYNYSDSTWTKLYCLGYTGQGCTDTFGVGGSQTLTRTVVVPTTSINNGVVSVRTEFMRPTGSGYNLYYYEGNLSYTTLPYQTIINNTYLDSENQTFILNATDNIALRNATLYISSNIVLGVNVTTATISLPLNGTNTIGDPLYKGFRFIPARNMTLTNVTLMTGDTSSECRVNNDSNNILNSSSVSGGVANFDYNLTSGVPYRIVCGGGGATMGYNPATFTGLNTSYGNITNQIYSGGIQDVGHRTVQSITIKEYGTLYYTNSTTVDLGALVTTVVSIPVSLADGVYSWFWRVYDWANNLFTTDTYTTTIDTVNGTIFIDYPNYVDYTYIPTQLNATIYDVNPANLTLNMYGVTNRTIFLANLTWYNSTYLAFNPLNGTVRISNLAAEQGTNTWRLVYTDLANRISEGEVVFFVDSVVPTISFIPNSDGDLSYQNRSYIVYNVTTYDANLKNLSIIAYNVTGAAVASSYPVTSGSNFTIAGTLSGLSDGNHTIVATSCDNYNWCTNTSRLIFIDLITPVISFTNPTPAANNLTTAYDYTALWANVTVQDTYPNLTILNIGNNGYSNTQNFVLGYLFYSPTATSGWTVNNGMTYDGQSGIYYPGNTTTYATLNATLSSTANYTAYSNYTVSGYTGTNDEIRMHLVGGQSVSGPGGSGSGGISSVVIVNQSCINLTSKTMEFKYLMQFTSPGSVNYRLECKNKATSQWIDTGYLSQSFFPGGLNYGQLTLNDEYVTIGAPTVSSFYNWTGLADGEYNITALAYDKVGRISSQISRVIHITGNAPINMTYTSPTPEDAGGVTTNYIPINVSLSEPNIKNITIRLYGTQNYTATSGSYVQNFYNAFTVPDGTYTYNATAWDIYDHRTDLPTRLVYKEYGAGNTSICKELSFPGTYSLIRDLNKSTGVCLDVKTSGVTIDCKGHSITTGANGISIATSYPNTQIINCNVYTSTSNGTGVRITGGNTNIRNSWIDGFYGIFLQHGSLTMSNDTIANNVYGLYMTSESTLTVINETGRVNSSNPYRLAMSNAYHFRNPVILSVYNSTGSLIGTGNYTVTSNGTILNTTSQTYNNVKISYTYQMDASNTFANLNNVLFSSNTYGIYQNHTGPAPGGSSGSQVWGPSGSTYTNVNFTGTTTDIITLLYSDYNKFTTIGSTTGGEVRYSNSSNNYMSSSALGTGGVVLTSSSKQNTFHDTTYSGTESVDSSSVLYRSWTTTITTRDNQGNTVGGSTVHINDGSNKTVYTNPSGSVVTPVNQYVNNGTVTVFNPYEIFGVLTDYGNSIFTDTQITTVDDQTQVDLTFAQQVRSTLLSRQVGLILMAMILLIGLAASTGFFIVKMRNGESVADIWKYFIIMMIWNTIFLVLFLVLGRYVMQFFYP